MKSEYNKDQSILVSADFHRNTELFRLPSWNLKMSTDPTSQNISLHSRGCHFWPTSFKFGRNVNFCNSLDNFVGKTNQIVFTQILGSFPKYFGFGVPRRILDGVSPQISFDIIEVIFLYKFKAHFVCVLAGYIMSPNVYFTFSLLNHTLIQIFSNSTISNNENLMKDDFALSNL